MPRIWDKCNLHLKNLLKRYYIAINLQSCSKTEINMRFLDFYNKFKNYKLSQESSMEFVLIPVFYPLHVL